MKKRITEKKILSMLSNAIEDIEVDVWNKIKNSQQSGLEEISSSHIESLNQNKTFVPKRIVSIAAVFAIIITGIYLIKNISEIISTKGLNSDMYHSPFLAIAESNNRLFYQNFKDEGKLYSMDLNGNSISKLSNDSILNFTIYDDSVYYINSTDGKIVVLKTNGSDKRVLENTNANWNIIGFKDWIFYTSNDGIYRVKNDGSKLEKISDILAHTLTVYGDNIYFSSNYENQEGLYKADLNGKNAIRIYNKAVNYFSIYKNNIFFSNIDDNYCLYKIATDGSNLEKVRSSNKDIIISTGTFDIFNGELYFTNESLENESYLFKLNIDTNNLTKLSKIEATTIKVFNQYIYLYHPSYNGRLYRLNITGKNLEEIFSDTKEYRNELVNIFTNKGL
ncbi:DUF5050 domain-containing protein [Acetivibrio clariflavus]|uniref:DUF5050 domain-containing protein n=1 Tax=Acetivibrio clariflavus TaxID=288965 RepID=UPI00047F836E|nr:DUF5050 domain-containing protein [Acetivibrio clariflavus]